jgi:hypothetical protein
MLVYPDVSLIMYLKGNVMHEQVTRRRVVGSTLLAAVATAGLSRSAAAAWQQDATPQAGLAGENEATMPNWVFVVHDFQDPYAGTISWPPEPLASTRYIGVEVEVRNESDVPLNFGSTSVRLAASDGTEHNPGTAIGTDPQLGTLNMSAGSAVRGWVWFTVPEDTDVMGIVYIAPSPRLMVALSKET